MKKDIKKKLKKMNAIENKNNKLLAKIADGGGRSKVNVNEAELLNRINATLEKGRTRIKKLKSGITIVPDRKSIEPKNPLMKELSDLAINFATKERVDERLNNILKNIKEFATEGNVAVHCALSDNSLVDCLVFGKLLLLGFDMGGKDKDGYTKISWFNEKLE